MNPKRALKTSKLLIEEFHWNSKPVVYINNKLFGGDFDSAISEKINVTSGWKGKDLFWQFDDGVDFFHEVSDYDLRMWLSDNDRSYIPDDVIRNSHAVNYIKNKFRS